MMSTSASSPDPGPDGQSEAKNKRRIWTKILLWAGGSIVVLVLLALVAVSVLLHNARFHHYLLALAEKKATEALGVRVQLQNFTLHLSDLSLDLYGLTVNGAKPYTNLPLLQVRHLEVGLRVVSILHRKWYLDEVRIDDPVARIFADSHGISNLPKLRTGTGGGHTNLFTLGIRHAVLDHGEVNYNNRKILLEANLQDLNFQSAFHVLQDEYTGRLSYRNGHLRFGSFNPLEHSLTAQFIASPKQFQLTPVNITAGASQLELTATLKDYSSPQIQGNYRAQLSGADVRRILQNSSIPSGIIETGGSIQYQYDPKRSFLNSAAVEGKLSSSSVAFRIKKIRAQVRDIAARYSLANGDATVRDFHARLLGGKLTATLAIKKIGANSRSQLNAALQGASLSDLRRIVPASQAAKDIDLTGVLNADADANWGENLNDLVAHTNATIQARVSNAQNQRAPNIGGTSDVIPVNGVIHGTYSAATKQIALKQSYLRMPQTTLDMNGTISNRSRLAIQLRSGNLAELETIADLFRTPKPGTPLQPIGLAGTASFVGFVRGSTSAPHLTGQLDAANLAVHGTKWRTLRTTVDLSPAFASLQDTNLEPVSGGHVIFNANAELKKWSVTKTSSIQIELHASKINIADLAKATGLQSPIIGTLTANIHARGTEMNPNGQGNISLTHAEAYGEPIQSAALTFNGTHDQVQSNLTVHAAAGTLHSMATIHPKEKTYMAQVTSAGIQLGELHLLKSHHIDTKGLLTIDGHGQGSLNNPQLDATLQIPQLEVQRQTIHGLGLQLAMSNHVVTANLSSQALNTSISAQAKVNLSGEYYAEATLDTKNIPLQPLLAAYAPSEASGIQGQTEVHATLRGPLKNKKLLEAHVNIPILKLNYGNTIQLAAAAPLHLDYKNGTIDLQRAAIRGTDTALQIQASVPIESHAPISLLLLGSVNLQLAQLFDPDVKSSGEVRFNINSYGVRTNPNVEGQVEIANVNFTNGNLPVGVRNGNGVLTLTKDRLNVKSFKATVGGGTLTAQGGVAYRPSIQFDLGAAAKGVRMLYPQGMREELDADLRLTGTQDDALLGGRVRLQDLSFTPDFDLTNFAGQLSGGITPPPAQGFAQNLRLNLALNSTNNLNLVSRTLSIDGTANLQVRGTAADPVILGRVNLSNGDIIFNGSRFTLNGGTIEFVNPAQTQPVVNIALNTTIQQYNIHLRFNGPVDQLRTNYSSDPSLPAADIINLLAFGQTTEAAAANPTPGDQAAMSAVASQVSSQITSRVAKIAGISQLSINPVLAGGSAQGPAGAIVTIQQRVTGNLFVTFSTNVTSTQQQVIMGQYRLSPKVSVSATRDQNGGIAFDTTFKKSW